jgi:hypothetical protein
MTGTNPFGRAAFLRGLAEELDPPHDQMQLARERYEDLGRWLRRHAAHPAGPDVQVYPQGSGNLGTTNRNPYTGEFDIDLVIRIDFAKWQITQKQLNQLVNGWLGSYVSGRQASGHRLAPTKLDKGKRAWTLHYADGFHMDILPVVPDLACELDASMGDPSWLTDKELTHWQPTNPRGFADWFREISAAEHHQRKLEAAKRAEIQVDELPDDQIKTSLQLTVQLLKRHRDHMFRDDPDRLAPPSAVITALASQAYRTQTLSGGDLANMVNAVLDEMPNHLHRTSTGKIWVPNPTCSQENYADRYDGRPDKEKALAEWLQQAQDDFTKVLTLRETTQVSKAIDEAFGPGLGPRIAKKLGRDSQQLRILGALGSTETGRLTTNTNASHRPHRFYGQPDS